MRRMSSLPTLQHCGRSDQLGKDVESIAAFRSTIFHHFCDSGEWRKDAHRLPDQDLEEIKRWKKPGPLVVRDGDVSVKLDYKDAEKETVLGLDYSLNFVLLDSKLSQEELQKVEGLFVSGHMDMGWDVPSLDLVVVSDIKSSIHAVKDRAETLQLHGYGLAYAKMKGRSRYLTDIWDASDGKHYLNDRIISVGSFEFAEIEERIKLAANNDSNKFTKGTHCSGCWKRDSCPAHLVDLGDENRFASLFNGTATESDVRNALVEVKGLGELANKVGEYCKDWTKRHGPVRSEDGRKSYRPREMAGRSALDKRAIAQQLGLDNLDNFMIPGESFLKFDWYIERDK